MLDAKVPSEKDQKTGLAIHSLYGETRRPTAAMLEGLDAIVIDLQDIGARFYTYITTTAFVIEEAAKRNLQVFVLDRPNPINGFQIEGPGLDKSLVEFISYFPGMPVRHGMTLGELAQLFNGENKIGAALTVVPMKNWDRGRWFDETGQPWINPSPNMRNLLQATLYPGVGAIEYTNISVGRGTDTPFEQIGAPWIDGVRFAETLNARAIPGVRFYPVRFTPVSSKYAKEECQGVFMVVTDRARCGPCGSASSSRRRCTGSTARHSNWNPRSACSDRETSSPASAPAKTRRQSSRPGARRKRAGGCCARSTAVRYRCSPSPAVEAARQYIW